MEKIYHDNPEVHWKDSTDPNVSYKSPSGHVQSTMPSFNIQFVTLIHERWSKRFTVCIRRFYFSKCILRWIILTKTFQGFQKNR